MLAALQYILRIAETTTVESVTSEHIEESRLYILQDKEVPPYVTILRIHGPFLFGTTEKLEEATSNLDPFASVVILRIRNMTALDATGLYALEKLAVRLTKSGRTLLLCDAREQPKQLLAQAEFVEHVGIENILPHVSAAMERARQITREVGKIRSQPESGVEFGFGLGLAAGHS